MEVLLLGAAAAICSLAVKARNRRRRRRIWTKKWILLRQRHGAYNALLRELQDTDPASARNFLTMDAAAFADLLELVGPQIAKKDTVMRTAIPAGERLALTLRFLASGKLASLEALLISSFLSCDF